MKNISILGSTGSIGTQALSIVDNNKDLNVVALAAGRNINLLEKQARRYSPMIVSCSNKEDAKRLSLALGDTDIKVLCGMEGLIEAATIDSAQLVLTAVVGMLGIRPTIAAIEAGKDIALANKETLVCAGHIIMPLARKHNTAILPVDSEHSAIFQSLQGRADNSIKSIILTASGGPFRGKKLRDLKDVTPEVALAHPNWDMGAKISIDSSTMVNKGLEVMEAVHLFDVEPDRINVTVHKESILHSAVEFEDGSVIGQMGVADMRIPLAYAFFYPQRRLIEGTHLSLTDISTLTFEKPDLETFRGLALCLKAANQGGIMPTVLNAANEVAVAAFLEEKIPYLGIVDFIEESMEREPQIENPSIDDILEVEKRIRNQEP